LAAEKKCPNPVFITWGGTPETNVNGSSGVSSFMVRQRRTVPNKQNGCPVLPIECTTYSTEIGIELVLAFRANTVAEVGLGMIPDIPFNLGPITMIITDPLIIPMIALKIGQSAFEKP